MLLTGLELMVIGMAVVFLFLTLLVLVLKIVGSMLKGLPAEVPGAPVADDTTRQIAAALAAITNYKQSQAR